MVYIEMVMTRKLNKKVWPYNSFIKTEYDDEELAQEREQWLWQNLQENIRNRIYIVDSSKGITYYFKEEKDYQWFIWRWV